MKTCKKLSIPLLRTAINVKANGHIISVYPDNNSNAICAIVSNHNNVFAEDVLTHVGKTRRHILCFIQVSIQWHRALALGVNRAPRIHPI